MDDMQLLRAYAENRSERAFTELVQRHMDFVYSTAFRLVNERQAAEDITQVVFIRLSRKAGSLPRGTLLTGWLYRTTQFVAQATQRTDWRRRKRENLAMESSEIERDQESAWKEVAPLLEQAMGQLRQADQDALLLRFFAGKSLREVGETLGVSDDTAQKRIHRALERLRSIFAMRGVVVSAAVIAPAIAAHAVQAAPAGLGAALVSASLTSGAAAGLGVFTPLNILKAAVVAQLKTSGAGVLTGLLLVGAGTVFLLRVTPDTPNAALGSGGGQTTNAALLLRGTVRSPDGRPLAGALVRAATPQINVRLYQIQSTNSPAGNASGTVARTNAANGASNQLARASRQAPSTGSGRAPSTHTAADGSFTIPLPELPKDGLAAVVVNSDAGYALVTAEELAANPNVVVQPWARIEGVLRIGKAPAGNQTVNIGIWGSTELYDWNLVQHGASTRTDAQGRFVFPQVAPVDVWLTRTVMVRTNDGRQSGHHYLKVTPGARLQVQLGGVGWPLTGRVLWESTNQLVFYGSMWANQARGMRRPRNWKDMSREDQRYYERAWRDSPDGELFKDSVRNYEFPVRPDGTFRVEDVRPGTYRMQVRADEPRPDGKGSRHAAVVEVHVDVPEMADSQNDNPIDLGTLVPEPVCY